MILPNHVAIIMDGNGRWGVKKYNNRLIGHQYGIKNIKNIINFFLLKKIKNVTLYAFSHDNFCKRKKKEINNIFDLLEKYLGANKNFFIERKINLNFIGERKGLPSKIKKIINQPQKGLKFSKSNLKLNIAFNYSSKLEIITAIKKVLIKKNKINIKNISKNLYTWKSNDPDLIIRTGGHNRLSDFLLWQSAYTEIFFIKKLWPDFKVRDLNIILKKYQKITQNFGS